MPDYTLLCLLPLAFLTYFCKATTGFGSTIMMVAVGSLIIGPLQALVLAALLEVAGSVILLRLDVTKDARSLWIPLSLAMVLGLILGVFLLGL